MTLKELIEDHMFFRRWSLLWAQGIITWVIWYVLEHEPKITVGTATMVGSVCGLLTAVIGLYTWDRNRSTQYRKTIIEEGDV